jgi:hypothetical protein
MLFMPRGIGIADADGVPVTIGTKRINSTASSVAIFQENISSLGTDMEFFLTDCCTLENR